LKRRLQEFHLGFAMTAQVPFYMRTSFAIFDLCFVILIAIF